MNGNEYFIRYTFLGKEHFTSGNAKDRQTARELFYKKFSKNCIINEILTPGEMGKKIGEEMLEGILEGVNEMNTDCKNKTINPDDAKKIN